MKKFFEFWKKISPLTRKLCLFAIINIAIINLVLAVWPWTNWHATALNETFRGFFMGQIYQDSWSPMKDALDYIQSHPKDLVYNKIFFEDKTKFQYPLTSLLSIYLLGKIFPDKTELFNILNVISWFFLVGMIIGVIKVFELSYSQNFPAEKKKLKQGELVIIRIILIALSLTFYPVAKAYSLGQIQTWLNSIFAILLWCWMTDKKSIAGILAGIMCLIKPQYALIFFWGILRKQWKFVQALLVTGLIGLLISILLFGLENNINYLSVLSFISRHGETYYHNQSINGLLNRMLFNGNILEFEKNSFSPFNILVYLGTAVSSIALIGMALFMPKKSNERGSITDLSIIALSATIASPVAWQHHYGIILPIYAFLLPCLLKNKIFGKITIPYLCISYILCSNYFDLVRGIAYAPYRLNIFMSYLFAGGLMVLAALYVLRGKKINNIDNSLTSNTENNQG